MVESAPGRQPDADLPENTDALPGYDGVDDSQTSALATNRSGECHTILPEPAQHADIGDDLLEHDDVTQAPAEPADLAPTPENTGRQSVVDYLVITKREPTDTINLGEDNPYL